MRALILHAQQLPDDRLSVLARATSPGERSPDYAESVRQERNELNSALDSGLYTRELLHDTVTLVQFEPVEFFHTGLIRTHIPYFTYSLRRSIPAYQDELDVFPTHYEYVLRKVESGLEILSQIETIIGDFLLIKALEGASFFGRSKSVIFTKEWIELLINTLYGLTIAIYWADGCIRINDDRLYGIVISAPKMETLGSLIGKRRRGPKP